MREKLQKKEMHEEIHQKRINIYIKDKWDIPSGGLRKGERHFRKKEGDKP